LIAVGVLFLVLAAAAATGVGLLFYSRLRAAPERSGGAPGTSLMPALLQKPARP